MIFARMYKHRFLFWELTKRDFKNKYKRTVLGVVWSMLAPLMLVIVQSIIFVNLLGRDKPHFVAYIFSGNIFFSYFREATNSGMAAYESNAGIISKICVPKYMFLLSRNVSSFVNMVLTLFLFIMFCSFDKIEFTWRFLLIPFPVFCLLVFNIGIGLMLSALYVFFRDTRYLYDIFCTILMYFSAIFYTVDSFPPNLAILFYCNPMFTYIMYLRKITIFTETPSMGHHLLCLFYALAALLIGMLIYYRNNRKFLYYL